MFAEDLFISIFVCSLVLLHAELYVYPAFKELILQTYRGQTGFKDLDKIRKKEREERRERREERGEEGEREGERERVCLGVDRGVYEGQESYSMMP